MVGESEAFRDLGLGPIAAKPAQFPGNEDMRLDLDGEQSPARARPSLGKGESVGDVASFQSMFAVLAISIRPLLVVVSDALRHRKFDSWRARKSQK